MLVARRLTLPPYTTMRLCVVQYMTAAIFPL